MPRIIVQAIEGRSLEQKRHLVSAITTGVVDALSVEPETVTVVIEEISREHISKAGVLYSDRPAKAAGPAPANDRS
ncbi:4-oxalocrotonate tautomerase [Streptomyces sp. HNM0575]|uniref:tautomerase family protein n=1 Tax=Streptomyces sp. HNM0575 TaxID=2716338 RepID=UPI00145E2652|nr:tautomerase family protein [Streptomyces sp. HNM0575]NLU72683.1 4-oxalocrotonate tautomerase [Streptomyces sp. HNM0575]